MNPRLTRTDPRELTSRGTAPAGWTCTTLGAGFSIPPVSSRINGATLICTSTR